MDSTRWSLLDGLPEDVTRRFLAGARRRRFARGEVLFHEGDPGDTLHLVAAGRLAVRKATLLGDETTLGFRGPGEAVGELALIGAPAPRSATVVAVAPTQTLAVRRADLEDLLADHPLVLHVLVRILADRVRELSSQVLEARYVAADVRVRRRILEMCRWACVGNGSPAVESPSSAIESPPVTIAVTQEDLAGLAGTTRGTVNRVVQSEARRGTLTSSRGRIVVLDAIGLARRAD